ncbi:MAG: histone [Methanomicrobiales archaeon]|nr:histone [Methanomicrobiales archaeon]
MADLPVAAVVRVAKNNGAERVGADAAAIMVAKTEEFLGQLVKEANKLAIHAGRKTLKEEDIEMAAEKFA